MGSADAAARPRLYLIDGSGYVYRAFHALPGLGTTRGLPTNAVYGFTTMLAKLLREEQPQHVAVVFDAPGETFRDDLFASYKENRAPMPDELRPQLGYIRKVVEALRLPTLEVPGVEADDVIGTLARQAARAAVETVLVTGDKDLMQLVDERTVWLDPMRERRYGVAEVRERFGVDPELVPDVLGLMGDAIDNIPGVTGIGEKTASALVRQLGPIEAILDHLPEVERSGVRGAKKIRETLAREAETARLSKVLATIRCDVPIRLDLEALRYPGPDRDRLRPLFAELEFTSLLRDLAPGTPAAEVEVTAAETREATATVLPALRRAGVMSVAATFDSVRTTAARLETLAVGSPGGPVVLVSSPEAPEALAPLAPLFADLAVAKVGADLKALRVALGRRGLALVGPTFDLALASYCLNPSRAEHGIAVLAEELLGEAPDPGAAVSVATCRAARAALALRPLIEERLRAHEMDRLFRELEMPLSEVLAEMELAGIALDVPALARLSTEFGATLERLMAEIYALAGCEFNISSPPQLRTVLFERLNISPRGVRRGKTGLSTDVDVLTRLATQHPLPAKILEYRALAKLKSTYVDALPVLVDPTTRRLHTSFNQTVAATGRLSSSDPNLQNIPIRTEEGRRIRAAFVAAPGHRLLSADYSQIELRVLAALSGDRRLSDAFRADEDIHARTAAEVFADRPPAEGRRLAKVINFGIVYGMGPARAARELGVPQVQAAAYIEAYFARYPEVRAFVERTVAEARTRGFVTTVLGRRRYLPELNARDPAVRQFAERAATNTPIQGSAADLIKLAMLEVRRRLLAGGLGARMLLQVHDELLFEVPEAELGPTKDAVRGAMEQVWSLGVPLRVDLRDGANWTEAH
ncbi:MAG TPA: DNA polymerase I [Candidatus Binatus sp.]|jgi:DNA polymerase I|nr:DNA polymerase I [Candidatus Binatus sp.]